jgi:hypothetical protein
MQFTEGLTPMTTAPAAIVNIICKPGFDAESMPFSETQAIAQQRFGSAHKVDLPYLGAGTQQVRFDVITNQPEALRFLVAKSARYQLR